MRLPFLFSCLPVILSSLLLGPQSYAQKYSGEKKKEEIKSSSRLPPVSLSVQPLFAFIDGLKLDIEMQKRNRHSSFIISPEFYTGSVRDKSSTLFFRKYEGDKITGFGLGLLAKYRLSTEPDGWYISYGITSRRFLINYTDEGYVGYTENNLHYYEYGNFTDQLKINSYLVSLAPGVQIIGSSNILLDLYLGIGYKFRNKKSEYPGHRTYERSPIDFGGRGFVPLAGFKIGYQIRK